jgi:hypothetical protein
MNPLNPGQSVNPIAPRKALERCIGASTKVRKIVLAVHAAPDHTLILQFKWLQSWVTDDDGISLFLSAEEIDAAPASQRDGPTTVP